MHLGMNLDLRRPDRLPLVIPVELAYADQNGKPCLERTQTKEVARHGARVLSRACLPEGSKVNMGVTHLGRSSHCRVVWCSAPVNGCYEVGLELESPENIWGVDFSPSDRVADIDTGTALQTLMQMLEEKGIITREEVRARISRTSAIGLPDSRLPGVALPIG